MNMPNVALVALDLLREAASRKWILAVAGAISLSALLLTFTLQMEVVDGVLAGTRLFGDMLSHTLRATDVALRPVFVASSWCVFVAGVLFGVLSCSDFAPELLAPGRIESMLALPLRRFELMLGTYAGVMCIALLGALYAGGVFTLLLGLKSGVWSPAIMVGGLAGCVAFSAIYGAMLACAVFVRSAALSAAVGGLLTAAAFSITLPEFAAVFEHGWKRELVVACTAWLPRLWLLGHLGPSSAGLESMPDSMLRAVAATLVFGLACLALATWEFERKDF
jgi:Cu-processing system permease protein